MSVLVPIHSRTRPSASSTGTPRVVKVPVTAVGHAQAVLVLVNGVFVSNAQRQRSAARSRSSGWRAVIQP